MQSRLHLSSDSCYKRMFLHNIRTTKLFSYNSTEHCSVEYTRRMHIGVTLSNVSKFRFAYCCIFSHFTERVPSEHIAAYTRRIATTFSYVTCRTRTALSRAHTSARAQQSHLITTEQTYPVWRGITRSSPNRNTVLPV